MSRWKRLDRKHRALYLTLTALALLAIATGAWASRAVPAVDKARVSTSGGPIGGQLPTPTEVLIQKTSAFPDRGNILVMVRLSEAQLAAKSREGTRSFVTLGALAQTVVLRDDGKQGDADAGDGLFTGIGMAHDSDLEARANADREEIERSGGATIPRFAGRTLVGEESQRAFDYEGFRAGKAVVFDSAVISLSESPALKSSRGPVKQVNATFPPNQFAERVLMIRDVGVVTDKDRTINPCDGQGTPGGVWTFEHLMTEMANQTNSGIDPSLFTEEWLKHWVADQTINTFGVPKRTEMQAIIDQWRAAGGGEQLNLKLAPFRLLAIVNRPDLRRTTGGGGGYPTNSTGSFLDAGEARFIFGLVLPPGWTIKGGYEREDQAPRIHENGCRALPYSVIFEYRVPKCHCEAVVEWAKDWMDLDNYVPGTGDYNKRLERLTEQFVTANANPTRPNGSAIGQVRTNEIALLRPWELREFQLVQFPWSLLAETTTADTPDDSFNNTTVFRDWVLGQVAPGLAGPDFDQAVPGVPLFFQSKPFLGAGPTAPSAAFFWDAPGLTLSNLQENWGRHRASFNTCDGCHAAETNTIFVHVDPATPGLPADLSGFLTGNTVPDPAFGTPVRKFNDLVRREEDIRKVAEISCIGLATADEARVKATLLATGALPDDLFEGQPPADHGNRLSVGLDDLKRNAVHEVH